MNRVEYHLSKLQSNHTLRNVGRFTQDNKDCVKYSSSYSLEGAFYHSSVHCPRLGCGNLNRKIIKPSFRDSITLPWLFQYSWTYQRHPFYSSWLALVFSFGKINKKGEIHYMVNTSKKSTLKNEKQKSVPATDLNIWHQYCYKKKLPSKGLYSAAPDLWNGLP